MREEESGVRRVQSSLCGWLRAGAAACMPARLCVFRCGSVCPTARFHSCGWLCACVLHLCDCVRRAPAMPRDSTVVASRCANVVAGAGSVRSSAGT